MIPFEKINIAKDSFICGRGVNVADLNKIVDGNDNTSCSITNTTNEIIINLRSIYNILGTKIVTNYTSQSFTVELTFSRDINLEGDGILSGQELLTDGDILSGQWQPFSGETLYPLTLQFTDGSCEISNLMDLVSVENLSYAEAQFLRFKGFPNNSAIKEAIFIQNDRLTKIVDSITGTGNEYDYDNGYEFDAVNFGYMGANKELFINLQNNNSELNEYVYAHIEPDEDNSGGLKYVGLGKDYGFENCKLWLPLNGDKVPVVGKNYTVTRGYAGQGNDIDEYEDVWFGKGLKSFRVNSSNYREYYVSYFVPRTSILITGISRFRNNSTNDAITHTTLWYTSNYYATIVRAGGGPNMWEFMTRVGGINNWTTFTLNDLVIENNYSCVFFVMALLTTGHAIGYIKDLWNTNLVDGIATRLTYSPNASQNQTLYIGQLLSTGYTSYQFIDNFMVMALPTHLTDLFAYGDINNDIKPFLRSIAPPHNQSGQGIAHPYLGHYPSAKSDVVKYSVSGTLKKYRCIKTNKGQTPTNPTYWQYLCDTTSDDPTETWVNSKYYYAIGEYSDASVGVRSVGKGYDIIQFNREVDETYNNGDTIGTLTTNGSLSNTGQFEVVKGENNVIKVFASNPNQVIDRLTINHSVDANAYLKSTVSLNEEYLLEVVLGYYYGGTTSGYTSRILSGGTFEEGTFNERWSWLYYRDGTNNRLRIRYKDSTDTTYYYNGTVWTETLSNCGNISFSSPSAYNFYKFRVERYKFKTTSGTIVYRYRFTWDISDGDTKSQTVFTNDFTSPTQDVIVIGEPTTNIIDNIVYVERISLNGLHIANYLYEPSGYKTAGFSLMNMAEFTTQSDVGEYSYYIRSNTLNKINLGD